MGSSLQAESAACPAPGSACPNPSTSNGNSGQQRPLFQDPLFLLLPVFINSFQHKSKGQPHTSQHGKNGPFPSPKPPSLRPVTTPGCHGELPPAHQSPKLGKRIKTLQHDVCSDRDVPWGTFHPHIAPHPAFPLPTQTKTQINSLSWVAVYSITILMSC